MSSMARMDRGFVDRRAGFGGGGLDRFPDGQRVERLGQVVLARAADQRPVGALPAWARLRVFREELEAFAAHVVRYLV
jgi:hypothetical protein